MATIILWLIGLFVLICIFAYLSNRTAERKRIMNPAQARAASIRFLQGEIALWEKDSQLPGAAQRLVQLREDLTRAQDLARAKGDKP